MAFHGIMICHDGSWKVSFLSYPHHIIHRAHLTETGQTGQLWDANEVNKEMHCFFKFRWGTVLPSMKDHDWKNGNFWRLKTTERMNDTCRGDTMKCRVWPVWQSGRRMLNHSASIRQNVLICFDIPWGKNWSSARQEVATATNKSSK